MRSQNAVLRAIVIGGTFLLLAIIAAAVSDAPALAVAVGLVLGWAIMWLLILAGLAVPGGSPTRNRGVGIGATIGVALAALLSSTLGLLDPSAPKLVAVGGLATCAGLFLALVPRLLRRMP